MAAETNGRQGRDDADPVRLADCYLRAWGDDAEERLSESMMHDGAAVEAALEILSIRRRCRETEDPIRRLQLGLALVAAHADHSDAVLAHGMADALCRPVRLGDDRRLDELDRYLGRLEPETDLLRREVRRCRQVVQGVGHMDGDQR